MIGYPRFNDWSGVTGSGAYKRVPRMPRRRRRALRRIEQGLVTSDPHLARLSAFFIQLAENEKMPIVEKVSRWPAWLLASVDRPVARVRRRVARLRAGAASSSEPVR